MSLPNIKIALVISPGQLVQSGGWSNFSRKAYLEPIVIKDGFHDFVLIGSGEFQSMVDELTAARAALKMVRWEDGDHGSCFITQAEFDRRTGDRA